MSVFIITSLLFSSFSIFHGMKTMPFAVCFDFLDSWVITQDQTLYICLLTYSSVEVLCCQELRFTYCLTYSCILSISLKGSGLLIFGNCFMEKKFLSFPRKGLYYNHTYHKITRLKIHTFFELNYSSWQIQKACGMYEKRDQIFNIS